MVGNARAVIVALFVFAGCASEPASDCPSDSTSVGLTLPSGLGISIGEPGLRAAYGAIRDFFSGGASPNSQQEKARAADLAANAAAKEAAAPMSEEQKRALRAQAGEWVENYAEKCGR